KWNGSSFVGQNTAVAVDETTLGTFVLADVNGDGLPDLVTIRSDGYLYVRLNTTTNGSLSFSPTVTKTSPAPTYLFVAYNSRRTDFSGTGQQDIFGRYLA